MKIRPSLFAGCLAILALSAVAGAADIDSLPVQKEMPDPLIMNDGTRVTTPEQWKLRREEMKRIVQHYLTGTAPPPPGNVMAEQLDQRVLAGGAKFRRLKLSFGPEQKLSFEFAVFEPAAAGDNPIPTVVHISFFPTPGGAPTVPATSPSSQPASGPTTKMIERAALYETLRDPEIAAKYYEDALSRGYAVATFNYQQCGADNMEWRRTGFFSAYPDADWADLGAWAWSMSRLVDWLETQPFVDRTKIIAVGHSRLGKTALIAGAFDERFTLVAPAGSGCAGTGAFRFNGKNRGGKEGLEDLVRRFPQWTSPNLAQFAGNVEKLPFDQHWLIALCAPRAFISVDAVDDPYANGNALKQAWLAAKPAYELLGAADKLGIHFRDGGHKLTPEDWKAILDFSDKKLRGMKTSETFDQLPAAELLH